MRKAPLAEFLLTLVCGRRRATEIVGDLLEQRPADRPTFWWMILTTIVAFTWRWALAILVAASSILFGLTYYLSHFQVGNEGRLHPSWGMTCYLLGACVWSVVVLNALRFGVKSRLNGVGLGLASLLVVMACLKSSPFVSYIPVAAVMTYTVVCIWKRSLRGPFCSMVASAASYAGTFYLLMHLFTWVSSHSLTLILIQLFGYWFLSFIVEATVLTYTRRYLDVSFQ